MKNIRLTPEQLEAVKEENNRDTFNFSVLTQERISGDTFKITGYSKKALQPGDLVKTHQRSYEIVKETLSADARGIWKHTSNKDLYFEAECNQITIEKII